MIDALQLTVAFFAGWMLGCGALVLYLWWTTRDLK